MSGLQKHKQAGQSIFMSSMTGLANTLAVVATFLGTGPFYSASKDWVRDFALSQYGPASADFVTMIWGVICACLIFFTARASISTALMFGAVAVMVRFL
ncbi:MAG: hypothetical protein OEY94_01105 [Alphaproteobacteria bacterium]|nr:hypothetical protein [Alphaproteobacteria bacterium]